MIRKRRKNKSSIHLRLETLRLWKEELKRLHKNKYNGI